VNETMEMDPEYRSAAAELAALHDQQRVQLERRQQLFTVLAHRHDQHVKIPPTLGTLDPRDAARELASVDRQLEHIVRDIAAQQRAVDDAAGAASARALELARGDYGQLVAKVSEARRHLAAAEAARVAFLHNLERRGVRTGGLTAEG
jgi:hypothetical protein